MCRESGGKGSSPIFQFDFGRLCHRTVLIALRGAYRFTPAQAGTIHCRKGACVPHGRKTSCIHGRPACAFVKLRFSRLCSARHLTAPRSPGCRIAMRRGGVISALDAASLAPFGNGYGPCGVAIRSASMAGCARAFGGQGYVQLSSMAEPFRKLCRLSGIVTPHFGVEDI